MLSFKYSLTKSSKYEVDGKRMSKPYVPYGTKRYRDIEKKRRENFQDTHERCITRNNLT